MIEYIPWYKETFADLQQEDGHFHPQIKCNICRLKAPAASTRSVICEMCYDEGISSFQED